MKKQIPLQYHGFQLNKTKQDFFTDCSNLDLTLRILGEIFATSVAVPTAAEEY